MVDRIVATAAKRSHGDSPLGVSGPLLLAQCIKSHPPRNPTALAITHFDTRGAMWPYTGLRAGPKIMAYERASSSYLKTGKEGTEHYSRLWRERKLFRDDCRL